MREKEMTAKEIFDRLLDGAEYAGMRFLAEKMSKEILPTEYLHCGEVYG